MIWRPQYAGATILVAGTDFGTGSSRGARGLGADRLRLPRGDRPRFGDIFRTNATKAGLLPVILPEAIVSALQDAVEADPGTEVTVDLGRREVRAGAAGRRARPARAVRAARRAQLGRRARAARRARRGSGLRSRSTNIPAGG
jgi:3-isopropylmalate dehydratase small subunit